jgi:hypothetical protein
MIVPIAWSSVWICSGLDGLKLGALDMVTTFGGSGTSHDVASKSTSGRKAVGLLKPFWRRGADRLGKSNRFRVVLGKKEAFKSASLPC